MNLATLPDTTDPPGVDLNHEESPIDGLKQGLKADLGKQDQSWVKAAQDKKQLRKYEVEVLQKEGIHTVEIPDGMGSLITLLRFGTTSLWGNFWIRFHMLLKFIWSLTKYGNMGILRQKSRCTK